MSSSGHVKVVVRTRPTAKFPHDVIQLEKDGKTVSIHLPKNIDQLQGFINNQQQDWSFRMDKVFHNASQEEVYSECARELTTQLMDGYNATMLAYGQTGAGKTYTMTGATHNYSLRGVIPRAISQVFQEVRERQESSITVKVSYLEIYNEVVYDLLDTLPDPHITKAPTSSTTRSPPAPSKAQSVLSSTISSGGVGGGLTVSETDNGSVFLKGLTLRIARNEEEALNLLFEGELNRSISEHSLNKHSSRSHCVFTIHVESRSRTLSSSKYTISKLNLVDLAGSERLSKTNSTGQTQREAMYINKSLTFLEQVIRALSERHRDHIPYRQSKLTHILKDSLGGNCSTLMVANIWAEAAQIEETISTLRFATRMMNVSNEPVQNILHDPMLLVSQYEREIHALKQELAMHDTLANCGSMSYETLSEVQCEDIGKQVRLYVDGSIPEIEITSLRQAKEVLSQFKKLVILTREQVQSAQSTVTNVPPDGQNVRPRSRNSGSSPAKPKSKGGGKSTLVPPSQPATTGPEASTQEQEMVGESDGNGLGVGMAPTSQKHPASPMAATKKSKTVAKQKKDNKTRIVDSPTNEERHSIKSSTETGSGAATRPSTPPTQDEAFEMFKKEKGSEINRVFLENKKTMHSKQKEVVQFATSLNEVKRKIDKVRRYLDDRKTEREDMGGGGVEGSLKTDTGESIIDEEEYTALSELTQLKKDYRRDYENLQSIQDQVDYCKRFVDESRNRLITEFETWYRLSFIGEMTEQDHKKYNKDTLASSHNEENPFHSLQATLLKDDPATIAFYNAQLRTDRRVYEQKGGTGKKRPGHVISSVLNRPPGLMTVS